MILTVLMLVSCLPLSVLATGADSLAEALRSLSGSPVVNVSSLYFTEATWLSEYRAIPDENGVFYFDISLSRAPSTDGDILVYYRTVDDSAVSEWGDYEGIGMVEEAYVTLNKHNGYKARVTVNSTVIGDGFVAPTADGGGPDKNRTMTRRFIFELTRVDDGTEPRKLTEEEKAKTRLYCYLNADRYHYQCNNGGVYSPYGESVKAEKEAIIEQIKKKYPDVDPYEHFKETIYGIVYQYFEASIGYYSLYQIADPTTWINIPRIKYKGGFSAPLNFNFDDTWKNYAQSGICDVGISLYGQIIGENRDSDGNATVTIYYEYQGKRMPAVTLYLEGEFDDSKHFGWEHAFEYAIDGQEGGNRDDHMKDNFIGFTLYDNDGNVAYEIKDDMEDPDNRSSLGIISICNLLKQAYIDGWAVKQADLFSTSYFTGEEFSGFEDYYTGNSDGCLYYLKLPSNFVLADSYSYVFISDSSNTKEIRRVENGAIAFALINNSQPKIDVDESGVQMLSSNVNSLREGDPLRVSMRFNRPVVVRDPDNCYITLDVNGKYPVKLKLKQLESVTADGERCYYACDTLVFEGDISEITDIKIESLRNIKLRDGLDVGGEGIKSFFTEFDIMSKSVKDIYGYTKDLRTPVAKLSAESAENWAKSKSIDVQVSISGSATRFEDYVTVYYQWTNTPEKPEKYSSKLVFHTSKDKEALKSVIGTGNGEMFLHLMAVSSYGKTTVSDKETVIYTGEGTYTPFGPYRFDNTPPVLTSEDIAFVDSGSMKRRTFTVNKPIEYSGLQSMSLYYVDKDGNSVFLRRFTDDNFATDTNKLTHTVENTEVGVGTATDENGELIPERRSITFYWSLTDNLGNEEPRTAEFVMTFDTNDYLDGGTYEAAPDGEFRQLSEAIGEDGLTYVYDYSKRLEGGYAFTFKVKGELSGTYGINVSFKGSPLDSSKYTCTEIDENGVITLTLVPVLQSGQYDFSLHKTESGSTRYTAVHTVYLTNAERDVTDTKEKIDAGTLLINKVFQLSQIYGYFYKDNDGIVRQESYAGEKLPATFSSISKAKEYVLFREYEDIHIFCIPSATIADALNNGAPGYLKAEGEEREAKAGQYWIRYKSKAWTPTSGDSAWVYYYYGSSKLSRDALSANVQSALSEVANRIVSYGQEIILTDASLFSGYVSGNKMLDKYGMPTLSIGQVHNDVETVSVTKCGDVWNVPISFAADRNIYRSIFEVGSADDGTLRQYPIIGSFPLSVGAIYQYMTVEEFEAIEQKRPGYDEIEWKTVSFEDGEGFIDLFDGSGIYYIREMSGRGVSVYPICIDKEAPEVTFSIKTSENGMLKDVVYNGRENLNITASQMFIGAIAVTEYDDLAYVAVYKASDLSQVGVYSASELSESPVKISDGNYYVVVADRSGNHYTIAVKISASSLECKITETKNKYVKLTCNRKNDEILRYEVYLDGALVTSTYVSEQTFDKAGVYTIYIQDIYGNVFSEDEYTFTRNYPEVTWKYVGSDGKTYTYDPKKPGADGFAMVHVSDNQYKISTAVSTKFCFSEAYDFTFIGAAPEYTKSEGVETVVTIKAGQSFTLKVSYKNHSDCYTLYTGVVDVTPPSINVSAEVDMLANGEYELFDRWIGSGEISMDKIYYVLTEIGRVNVSNGAAISSDIIKITAGDANGLAFLEIYLDDVLLKRQDEDSEFSQIILSRWGSYRIVAKDTLGNVSTFTFTNGMQDGLDYYVDGAKKELGLHGYLNFNSNHDYTKIDYGNDNVRFDITENADIFMSVGVVGGNSVIYGFRVADGCIYPISYTILTGTQRVEVDGVITEETVKTVDIAVGAALINLEAEDFKYGKEYLISKDGAYAIYASVSADGTVSIKVYAPSDTAQTVSVSARVDFEGSDINFVSAELSKKLPELILEGVGAPSGTEIRTNVGFDVDEDSFADDRIESVRIYYSALNDIDVNGLEGLTDIYKPDGVYTDEGFYLLVIRNLYGSERVYRISVSRTFGVTSSVTFKDGPKFYYSKDYSDVLYSNYRITLDVLDADITYKVTLNGQPYNGYERRTENGLIYLVFEEDGSYVVTVTDPYGNTVTKRLSIDTSTFTAPESLLTGYNEKALKREDGYTNQRLTVSKAVLDSYDIYYLAIQYGDKLEVLLDSFAEIPVRIDAQSLIDAVGRSGDGKYTVICRNRYGSVSNVDIHYRGTPTLKLERTTRSQVTPEAYDLGYAITLGFWSNNTLSFSTEARIYEFTVNGNATECPRTLVFDSSGDHGSTEYSITYIDEYGFEYSFTAYLVRTNVTLNLPSDISGIEVDGILNTRDNVSITFGENVYATYTLNNGESVLYRSGEVLKKDGTYRFTVLDYAGNTSTLTVKKDTAVEFSFVDDTTGTAILNGGVVNSSRVELKAVNKDSISIERVLKDGVAQNIEGNKFNEDGKWEFILCDGLGNKAYFSFYVVTHSRNGFAYTTPYEYIINEIWYDSGDGVKIAYIGFVNQDVHSSSFEFTENGTYTVVMTSEVTGHSSTFTFTVNTSAPNVSLVGCNSGETTLNDVSVTGCKVGDRIKLYKETDTGEKLIQEIAVTSQSTQMPTVTEGGKYRIVVESEAGVATELTFVRRHVMNTAGSVFIMTVIGIAVIGLFTGLVYRNKSKTDE